MTSSRMGEAVLCALANDQNFELTGFYIQQRGYGVMGYGWWFTVIGIFNYNPSDTSDISGYVGSVSSVKM